MDNIQMIKMQIINSVLSIDLNTKLDIPKFRELFNEAYKPRRFPGTVFKIKDPRVAFLLFPSGKIICSGSRNLSEGKRAFTYLLNLLRANSLYNGGEPDIKVQNLVAIEKIDYNIDIENTVHHLDVMYEPEIFPGAICRIKSNKLSYLLFSNGYIIVSGSRDILKLKEGVEQLLVELAKHNLLFKTK